MNFNRIPHHEIKKFLTDNGLKPSNKDNDYSEALILVTNYLYDSAPEIIYDYNIAQMIIEAEGELAHVKKRIASWRSSLILTQDESVLVLLADQLMLTDIDRTRMINVLNFLNKLNCDITVFELLNKQLLTKITNNLDHQSITNLAQTCKFLKQELHINKAVITRNKITFGPNGEHFLLKNNIVHGHNGNGALQIEYFQYRLYYLNREGKLFVDNKLFAEDISYITANGILLLIVKHNGDVYQLGYNWITMENRNKINLIEGLNNVAQVSLGVNGLLALTRHQKVYHWDLNQTVRLVDLTNVVQISAGQNYAALTEDGKVYHWDNNLAVKQIPDVTNAKSVICGVYKFKPQIVIMTDQYIHEFGQGSDGYEYLSNVRFIENNQVISLSRSNYAKFDKGLLVHNCYYLAICKINNKGRVDWYNSF